ncbi:MAG TPA: hypothetical protein VHQ41_01010, partial [Patescibacteria group bacterium]|nr:hypothetical protein [Patescibacteria group bacterium]
MINNMKWFGREKAPAGPTAAEQKATQDAKDRESVLNDAKFMKSLDTHPNIDADSNLETLKQAHESFKVKETASKELQSLIKNEIKSDIGLSLDSKEGILVAEAIDKYLNGELIDNPERITELRTQIEKFHELNKKVEEQNQVLEKLGISVDALRGQNQAINKVQDTKKRFQMILGYSKEHKSARESATKEHGLSLSKLK